MSNLIRTSVLSILLSCALPFHAVAQAGSSGFTLPQVMSAPFNSDLIAAPTGKRLAWISNAEGRRNIWIADWKEGGTDPVSRQLTPYKEDDGQEIQDPAWSPDGQSIVYVRGGDPDNPEKMSPNPALFPQGAEQDIWLISAEGGTPKKLGPGNSPAYSPTKNAVAWVFDGQIWFDDLGARPASPRQLLHTLGSCTSLTWSPNGNALAFVSDRGNHSFIGVYDFSSNTLRYLDPGTDHDRYPEWSPDSRNIAFVRIPYFKGEDLQTPLRTGQPWSIRVADAVSGSGHAIWRAQPGPGSVFREVSGTHQLYWGDANTLTFPWEGDGWLHLYTIATQGGVASLRTRGDYEVEDVSISPDRKTIVYSSNRSDIDRRHIQSFSVAGGGPVDITHGTGIETAPVFLNDNRTVAILRSNAKIPMRPAVVQASGRMIDLAPQTIPPDFPANRMVTPRPVMVNATDGIQIHGQLYLPIADKGCKPHPAIVFVHGGSQRQMLLGWHSMGYYSNSYALNQYLVSRGYIVLSINYRSGIGYGLNFREALNYGPTGGSEFHDVAGAALYLRNRCDVARTRIGIWGGSWGGYLTAMALARASDLFAAGVDMSGVHDWNIDNPRNFAISDTELDPSARWRTAWRSSPLASVSSWRSPVLLIQGDDDRDVLFLQTVQLAAALRKQKVEVQDLIFPDEVHDFLLHRDWVAAYAASAAFFDEQLKAQKATAR